MVEHIIDNLTTWRQSKMQGQLQPTPSENNKHKDIKIIKNDIEQAFSSMINPLLQSNIRQLFEGIPTIRVGAIIVHNGKILTIKESQSHFWGFPKGSMDVFDKTLIRTLTREIAEEINYRIKLTDMTAKCLVYFPILNNNYYSDDPVKNKKRDVIILFIVRVNDDIINSVKRVNNCETIEKLWLSLSQLYKLKIRGEVSYSTAHFIDALYKYTLTDNNGNNILSFDDEELPKSIFKN